MLHRVLYVLVHYVKIEQEASLRQTVFWGFFFIFFYSPLLHLTKTGAPCKWHPVSVERLGSWENSWSLPKISAKPHHPPATIFCAASWWNLFGSQCSLLWVFAYSVERTMMRQVSGNRREVYCFLHSFFFWCGLGTLNELYFNWQSKMVQDFTNVETHLMKFKDAEIRVSFSSLTVEFLKYDFSRWQDRGDNCSEIKLRMQKFSRLWLSTKLNVKSN